MEYIRVAETESDEAVELPLEDDGTLLFSTLAGQFPGVCSLNYRNSETNSLRGVKLVDKKLHVPEIEGNDVTFFCVFPKENKRKSDESELLEKSKQRKVEPKCSDLIVLGLPWETRDDTLKEYFEEYGEVVMAQVKMNPNTEKSKGFGFVRFSEYADQIKVLSQRHRIDGRWCDVKIPDSKVDFQKYGSYRDGPYNSEKPLYQSCKIFIGRCTEDMKEEDLKDYFSKYGEVNDVFIPKPFRAFAFVTFQDSQVAQSLIGEDHIICGHSVVVTSATPKGSPGRYDFKNQNSMGGSRDMARNMPMNNPNNMGRNQGMGPNDPPVNMGQFNLGSLPFDSALVTALSQSNWGRSMFGNMQQGNNGPPPNFNSGGGTGGFGNTSGGNFGNAGGGNFGGPSNNYNSGGFQSGPQGSQGNPFNQAGFGSGGGGAPNNQNANNWGGFQRDQPGPGNRNSSGNYYYRR